MSELLKAHEAKKLADSFFEPWEYYYCLVIKMIKEAAAQGHYGFTIMIPPNHAASLEGLLQSYDYKVVELGMDDPYFMKMYSIDWKK